METLIAALRAQVEDEKKAVILYNNLSLEARKLGLGDVGLQLEVIARDEEDHRDRLTQLTKILSNFEKEKK